MQYSSLMIDVKTKELLKSIQEQINKKHSGKHSYSMIISTALYQYAKQEELDYE